MAVSSRAVTVGTTATVLDTEGDTDTRVGSSIAVYNNGASTLYLGGSGVTTTNGVPVAATSWGPAFDLGAQDRLYGIVASGTVDVRVIETGI